MLDFRGKVGKDDLRKSEMVLDDGSEIDRVYKPRTQETRNTFDVILAFIQEAIGDQVFLNANVSRNFIIKMFSATSYSAWGCRRSHSRLEVGQHEREGQEARSEQSPQHTDVG
jgi:hypothetical protein